MPSKEPVENWEALPAGALVDELKLPPRKTKTSMVSVRLDEETLRRLEPLATRRGVGVSTLLRMWALERLAQEAPTGTGS